jgi:hypothetical protein
MRETKHTIGEFRMILAADASLADAETVCDALGLKAEVKRIQSLRAGVMARLDDIQDRAYAAIGSTLTRQ